MEARKRRQLEMQARVLKALAHPSRLCMVELLADGERCVCELRQVVGADMSTVSKHLAVLKGAGIVRDEKRGLQVFYSLRFPCVLNFLSCVNELMTSAADEQRELCCVGHAPMTP
jgi:ArsR family transcriptional regulator